jgi:hypothetical protein
MGAAMDAAMLVALGRQLSAQSPEPQYIEIDHGQNDQVQRDSLSTKTPL